MAGPRPRVDQVLGAVPSVPVAEHGAPERQHLGNDERVNRDLDCLDSRWVGGKAKPARRRRDLPRTVGLMELRIVIRSVVPFNNSAISAV